MSLITSLEIIAVISGIICVILQTRERIEAWLFGIISVTILVYIFYQSQLYSDLVLHVVYIFLNIFGWYSWTKNKLEDAPSPILQLSRKEWVLSGTIIAAMTLVIGYLMGKHTDADLYYFDAFTTSGSLVAQFLLAKKYLQNWIIWIIVDLVAIPVYLYKELYFVAFLFFVYLLICIYGYFSWNKQPSTQTT